MTVKICVAVDNTGGFAKDYQIPWNIPEDFKHFMNTTKGAYCVTGRHSYEEMAAMKKKRLGKKYNPETPILSNRETFVVTSTLTNLTDATAVNEVSGTICDLVARQDKNIFVLGGERVFAEAIVWVDEIVMTVIDEWYDCDKFFPINYLTSFFKISEGWTIETKSHGPLKVVKYIRVLRG